MSATLFDHTPADQIQLFESLCSRASDIITGSPTGHHVRADCLLPGHSSAYPAFISIFNGRLKYHCSMNGHTREDLLRALSEYSGIPYVYLTGDVPFDPDALTRAPADREVPEKVERQREILNRPKEWVADYPYRDDAGGLVITKSRFRYTDDAGGKTFRVHPRVAELPGDVKIPLYNQHLVAADPDAAVYITEGEKDADNLNAHLVARGERSVAVSTYDGGGGTWHPEYTYTLSGHKVVVIPDNDKVGSQYLRSVLENLSPVCSDLSVLRVPRTLGKDVSDMLGAGSSLDDLEDVTARHRKSTGFSDAEVADRVADLMRGNYSWCKALGWLNYTGTRWEEVSDEEVREFIRVLVLDQIVDVAKASVSDPQMVNELVGWKTMLGAAKRTTAETAVRGILVTKPDLYDADPWKLNTPAGYVDLRTGDVEAHSPEHYCRQITHGNYRPGYTHPRWEQAVTSLPEESREWMRVRFGQAVTGFTTTDDAVVVLWGKGENAKTTMLGAAEQALGSYGGTAAAKLFLTGSENDVEIAELMGKRLVFTEEIAEGKSIDVTALKRIMGATKLNGRLLYKGRLEFSPSHSLFVSTNYRPKVAETDHGAWRRLHLVKYPYTYRKVGQELRDEWDRHGDPAVKTTVAPTGMPQPQDIADAVLTWMIEGCMRWVSDPTSLNAPEEINQNTRAWRIESDKIMGFWHSGLIEADAGSVVYSKDLLEVFNQWLTEDGHHRWTAQTFNQRFGDHESSTGVKIGLTKIGQRTLSKSVRAYRAESPATGGPIKGVTGVRFACS